MKPIRNIVLTCLLAASVGTFGSGISAHNASGTPATKVKNELARLAKYNYSPILGQHQYRYIGYIGRDFQRLYMYFEHVEKDTADATLYHVKGASRVRQNVCNFTGTIRLKHIEENNDDRYGRVNRYCMTGIYDLREDDKQKGAGRFYGNMTTDFYLYDNSVHFDDLFITVSDGYCNNMFEGKWTSFKTKVSKNANWGLFRIPDSNALDIGEGEFYINPKYRHNGWENYCATMGDVDTAAISVDDALDEERREWWRGKDEVRQSCKRYMLNDSTYGIKVYRNGVLVQTIVCPIDTVSPTEQDLGEGWFEDVTFDGHNDLLISKNGTGATPAYYECYTWDERKRKYVRIPSYSKIPNPSSYEIKRSIYGWKQLTKHEQVQQKYIFRNGEFVLHSALYVDHSGEKSTHYREIRMEKGKEVTVKNTDNYEDISPEWDILPF
ncbi:XAC2610-related protein [Hoylesella oralis]|uniref:XAC2610-related protein n=1 Tax=Hoylesella oralis TaxID=28134 RepID=UPI0028EA5166|nr:hypothetical protein [Hoylesella oralis]